MGKEEWGNGKTKRLYLNKSVERRSRYLPEYGGAFMERRARSKPHPFALDSGCVERGVSETDLHKLFVVYLNPSVSVGVDTVTNPNPVGKNSTTTRGDCKPTHPWKASVKVFTTTQALTKRSKVIPGAGP